MCEKSIPGTPSLQQSLPPHNHDHARLDISRIVSIANDDRLALTLSGVLASKPCHVVSVTSCE